MQLYKLADSYQYLYDRAESGDFDEETIKDTLESIEDSFDDKAVNTAYILKNLQASEKIIAEEIKRLTERKKSLVNNQKRLKDYLLFNMQKVNKTKIKSDIFTLSIRNSQAVEVEDLNKLNKGYLKISYSPDKTKIKDAIKGGEDVTGAKLVTNQSLNIR